MPLPPTNAAIRTAVGPAVAVLIDYDGTIATIDVTDELVRRSSSRARWLALETDYREGRIGSRSLLEAEAALLPTDPREVPDIWREQAHDPSFAPFVRVATGLGIPVEVVSDGLGFFVAPALASLGLPDLPVYTSDLAFGPDGPVIRFPSGNPACARCGTCKRDRVLAHRRLGRHVVFVGDGYSDRYAASYADTVFAKADLVGICESLGIPFRPWSTFAEVETWLVDAVADDRLAPPADRPFVCGPEAGEAVPWT